MDSRNVVGQAARILGEPAHPDVAGIVRAFSRYGFQVETVRVALALPRSGDRAELQSQLVTNEAFRDRVEAHPKGDVLLGELHARKKPGGRVEAAEKMVDTNCTVEVVTNARDIADGVSDYDAIIVLSEDIDLSPGYRFADGLGVPVYPAATGVVDRRGEYHQNFLLLSPDVLAEISPPAAHGRTLRGHDLRAATAQAFKAQLRLQAVLAQHYDGPHGGWVVSTEEGLLAIMTDREAPRPGASVDVFANSLHFGRREDPLFPYLSCSKTKATGDRHHRTATVQRWARPGVLDIAMNNGETRSLRHVPLGYATPKSKVVVYARDDSCKFVGLLGDPEPVPRGDDIAADTRMPTVVTITQIKKGKVRGTLPDGHEALLLTGRNQQVKVGDRIAVLIVGAAGPGWLAVQAISTALPPLRTGL